MDHEPSTRNRLARYLICSVLLAAAPSLPGLAQDASRESLVPASFRHVQDAHGHRWDVQPNGMISDGYNDCFDGAMNLRINNAEFHGSSNNKMRPDGQEYVLSHTVNNVHVTRRVLIDTKRGAARYLDILQSKQANQATLNVQLRTQLGGSCQQVVASSGKPFTGALGKRDFGICAIQPQTHRPSVFFMVADPRSKTKPAISAHDRRTITFSYNLKLKPQETVTLMHVIAQRRAMIPSGVPALAKQFYHRRPLDPQVPRDLRKTLLNIRLGPIDDFDAGPLLQTVMDLSEHFAVARGQGDFLVLGEEAQFQGQVGDGHLLMRTRFGSTRIPIDQVAMLIGGNGERRPMQLHLRNGEVLVGEASTDGEVVFHGERGLDVKLRPSTLDLLLLRTNKEIDGKPDAESAVMINTQTGDRLAVRNAEQTVVELATPWGPLSTKLNEIGRVWLEEDPVPHYRILLANRTRVPVVPATASMKVDTERWGQVDVRLADVNSLSNLRLQKLKNEDDESEAEVEMPLPYCRLAGSSQLVCTIDLDVLPLRTATGVLNVATSQVASLARSEDDTSSTVNIQLVSGREIVGQLQLPVLSIRTGKQLWRVPLKHFLEARLRKPGAESTSPKESKASEQSGESAKANGLTPSPPNRIRRTTIYR